MVSLDFPNARLPQLAPLAHSYAENVVEADLKRLFLDLFHTHLAADTFDVNVLGAAHLGSFDLVRHAVNIDGLTLLAVDQEEAATRFLYRAWKSGNVQGRGLHFLRTYLQILFPNIGEAIQLWQGKDTPYPTDLREQEEPDTFLTSRIRILIYAFPKPEFVRVVESCMMHVIPARFVVSQRYVATSSIGKIRPIVTACISQNFSSAGTLKAHPCLDGTTTWMTADIAHGAQHLQSQGGAT